MKKVLGVFLFLVGCGDSEFHPPNSNQNCTISKLSSGHTINCGKGDFFIPDTEDSVILSKVNVPKNTCTKVSSGIWVENIRNGLVFDVYYNSECKDSKGEFCDNVVPSDDSTGKVDEYRGSGTVCWANDVQISGIKKDNKDILVYVLDFN